MMIRYCTKRDINGNRKHLVFDPVSMSYARDICGWFHKSDYIQVTQKEIRLTIQTLKENGFSEVDRM